MVNESDKKTTRQKILYNAIKLFADKGYTETSVRELAAASGIKEASLYYHFPSKNHILEEILDEYSKFTQSTFSKEKLLSAIKRSPNAEGILSSITLVFPKGKEKYYLQMLYVMFQEQHRNPTIGKFMSRHYILGNEQIIRNVIDSLKELGIIRRDTDPDFWVKVHSSLLYAYASRHMLGIGDGVVGIETEYSGMTMPEILRFLYDLLIKLYGTATAPTDITE